MAAHGDTSKPKRLEFLHFVPVDLLCELAVETFGGRRLLSIEMHGEDDTPEITKSFSSFSVNVESSSKVFESFPFFFSR